MLGYKEDIMKTQKSEKISSKTEPLLTYGKWSLIGILVGIVLGVVASSFHHAVDIGATLFSKYDFILYLMPLAGIVIAAMYKCSDMENDIGTNSAILSIREDKDIKLRTAPLIYISSVLTHATGGSSGREGAALQLGSSIGAYIGKLLKLDKNDIKIIIMCGMSASFSALFGTPITAAIFSIELIEVGIMHYSSLVPCMISAITGFFTSQLMKITPTAFELSVIPEVTPVNIVKIIILSALSAAISILFCLALTFAGKLFKKIPNSMLRAFIGGIIVILATLLLGTRDYNGAGMFVIERAVNGEAHPMAFLIKIIMTAITLGTGYKGGEIVPTFFIGSTFGCFCASILGIDPGFGAAVGMVAIFCGVTNCPLASMFLAMELFGGKGMIFFAISCATSFMLSGYTGLYKEQKIVYSKTKPMFIDRKIH